MESDPAETYQDDCACLWEHSTNGTGWPAAVNGFWHCWIEAHATALKLFSQDSSDAMQGWSNVTQDLMKRRERLVSALTQGLHREKAESLGHQKVRSALAHLLQEHDTIYMRFIAARRNELRDELARAQITKRAIGAYSNLARQTGEG